MGQIERTVLGTATASKEGFTFGTRFFISDVRIIDPMTHLRVNLPPTVVINSIQLEFVSDVPVHEVNASLLQNLRGWDDGALHFFRKLVYFIGSGGGKTFSIVPSTDPRIQTLDEGGTINIGRSTIISGVDDLDPTSELTDLGNGVFQDPEDGSLALYMAVLRPHLRNVINAFGTANTKWFPFEFTVIVTGFVLSDQAQSSGIDGEQVSCLVIDENSKNLYGSRPSVREEQSDFIETQRQACRVAEAILWNRNMVLEKNLTTLFNPGIKRGQTARVTNIGNDIDFQGIVKSVGHQFNVDSGSAITEVLVRCTEYIFQSALGESNSDENQCRGSGFFPLGRTRTPQVGIVIRADKRFRVTRSTAMFVLREYAGGRASMVSTIPLTG